MPFVPLASRKPLVSVILDEDKPKIQAEQHRKDQAVIQAHYGLAPGAAGYRFANHPQTFGVVRGPDVPFRNATAPWRPASAEPDGPAGQKDREHAVHGAYWEASHGMKKVRSSPSLQSIASNVMEACHPLSIEIKRWERLSERTQKSEMKMDYIPKKPKPYDPPPKITSNKRGLVLFPKYMLIHNCHLKTQDLQRFQRQQAAEAAAAEAAAAVEASAEAATAAVAATAEAKPESFAPGALEGATGASTRGPRRFDASWGAPKVRAAAADYDPLWAGSAMPHGRGQRTSNPFRMG